MCIGLSPVFLKLGVIDNNDLVCSVLSQLIGKTLYVGTDKNGCNFFCIKIGC